MVEYNRRQVFKILAAVPLFLHSVSSSSFTSSFPVLRPIPSSGEKLPVIGLDTYRSFDVRGRDPAVKELAEVIREFFTQGGQLIHSAPMYGRAEAMTGELVQAANKRDYFAATQIYAKGREDGIEQMERSFERMAVTQMDLMQIHNLRDWKTHSKTIAEWKAQGRIRYAGITANDSRDFDELATAIASEQFDFVQVEYNALNKEAEKRIFPLAQDKGVGVIAARPFQQGRLLKKVRREPLPAWAAESGCHTWAQVFLKFIVSHPAVTCTIPGAARVSHIVENMGAGLGPVLDNDRRKQVEAYLS